MEYKLAILKGDKKFGNVIDRVLDIIKSTALEVTELPFGVNAVLSCNEPLSNQILRESKIWVLATEKIARIYPRLS